MSSGTLEKKVQKGMAFLDKEFSTSFSNWYEWYERINLQILNLQYGNTCILGQLLPEDYNSITKKWSVKKTLKLGFNLNFKHRKRKNWEKLNTIWKEEICKRKAS